ncbi:MAG TPA: FixH family protein [Burkholderiales bacterium]|nr:FixH family protein [Burkholderiales bacterium]
MSSFAITSAYACAPDLPGSGRTLEAGRYSVKFRPVPAKIAVGQHFSLEMAVCANGGAPPPESIGVDAQMPEHRHGMNYKASVKPSAGGRYRADGLMFHMPGRWEIIFELRAADVTDRATHNEVIE